MLEAAIYFQQREDTIDKAVLLYHRAGNLAKAIELVFKVLFLSSMTSQQQNCSTDDSAL